MKACVIELKQNKKTVYSKECANEKEAMAVAMAQVNGARLHCSKAFVANSDVVVTKSYYEAGKENLGQVSFKHGKEMISWKPFKTEEEYRSVREENLKTIFGKTPEVEKYRLYFDGDIVAVITEAGIHGKVEELKKPSAKKKNSKKSSAKKEEKYTVIEMNGKKYKLVPVED